MYEDLSPSVHLDILPGCNRIFPQASSQSAPFTQSFSLSINCGPGCSCCLLVWGPRPPLLGAAMKDFSCFARCFVSSLCSFFFKKRLMGVYFGVLSAFCNSPCGSITPGRAAAGQPAKWMESLQKGSWKYAVIHLLFPSCVAQFSDLPQSRPF